MTYHQGIEEPCSKLRGMRSLCIFKSYDRGTAGYLMICGILIKIWLVKWDIFSNIQGEAARRATNTAMILGTKLRVIS
jgi:hypothetical protein